MNNEKRGSGEVLRWDEDREIDFGQLIEAVDRVQQGNGRSIGEDCALSRKKGVAGTVEARRAVINISMVVTVDRAAGMIRVFGDRQHHAGRRMQPGILGAYRMAVHRHTEGDKDHQGQHGDQAALMTE